MDAQALCRVVPRVLWTLIPVLLAITSMSAAPASPANLVAHVVGSTVTLTWTAPVGPVSGYVLEAGSSSGLSDLARAAVGSAPAFVAVGVPAGTYFVRTRAFDAEGEGPPSNEVIVVVMGPCTAPPNAPFGLTSTVSGQVVSLTWASSGGCPPSNFALHVGTAPGLSNLVIVNMGLTTSLSASAPQGLYHARVFARNRFGTSGPSNEVIVQVTGQPSSLCRLLTAVLTPTPYGDPDKALMTARYPASARGSAFFSFTSYRRVGGQWIEYDWWRQQMVLPDGSSGRSEFIDKPTGGAWRLDFRCDGQVIAQREGSG
jgi:hypothetical protein